MHLSEIPQKLGQTRTVLLLGASLLAMLVFGMFLANADRGQLVDETRQLQHSISNLQTENEQLQTQANQLDIKLELAEMRATEGAAMLTDLKARCAGLQEMMQSIRTIGPATVERYRAKLHERVGELISGIEHDDERLHREVVVFADRCDITEELTRLDSHLEQMQTLFAAMIMAAAMTKFS